MQRRHRVHALLLEPLQAEVRDDIRGIAHMLDLLAVLLHARVVVGPLTVEHLVAVEARRVRLEVPFSNKGCGITYRFKYIGNG